MLRGESLTPWSVWLARDLLLVCVGLSLEVAFTAASALPKAKDWKLRGHTYLWMVPIYALIYPACLFIVPRLAPLAWPLRGLFYVGVIYAAEYSCGWLIRKATGHCPWEEDYFSSPWGVRGLIRLDFAPWWFGAGLLFESVYRFLRGVD